MTDFDRLNRPVLGWWLKIDTAHPISIYYFGPFTHQEEADKSISRYIDILTQKHIVILHAESRFCQPRQLTISENDLNIKDLEESSGQLFINLIRHHEDLDLQQSSLR